VIADSRAYSNLVCGILLAATSEFCLASGNFAILNGNEIFGNLRGIELSAGNQSGGCSPLKGSSVRAVLKHNCIYNNFYGVYSSGDGENSQVIAPTVVNNLVFSNRSEGFWFKGENVEPILVNNTVAFNAGAGLRHDAGHTSSEIVVRNNIIVGNAKGIVASLPYSPTPGEIGFNDVYGNGNQNWENYPPNYGTLDRTNANGTIADLYQNISIDPLFRGASDLHVLAASACVNAGSTNLAPELDRDNLMRFQPVDIGCYEAQPRFQFRPPLLRPDGLVGIAVDVEAARTFSVDRSETLTNWSLFSRITNITGVVEFAVPTNSRQAFFRARP
jgi:hypothetical protein